MQVPLKKQNTFSKYWSYLFLILTKSSPAFTRRTAGKSRVERRVREFRFDITF